MYSFSNLLKNAYLYILLKGQGIKENMCHVLFGKHKFASCTCQHNMINNSLVSTENAHRL